jgi:hypothetical protein
MLLLFRSILLLSLFLSFIPLAQAARGPKMEDIYGEDLSRVPPLIKSNFQSATGMNWSKATYDEREEFLAEWQSKRNADIAAEKNRLIEIGKNKKMESKKKAQKAREKRAKDRALMAKEKAKAREKRKEEKKKRELVDTRQDSMRNLKKAQARRRRD